MAGISLSAQTRSRKLHKKKYKPLPKMRVFLEGDRNGGGGGNYIRLEVVAGGHLPQVLYEGAVLFGVI